MTTKAHSITAQMTIEEAQQAARKADPRGRIGVIAGHGRLKFYILTEFGIHKFDTLAEAVRVVRNDRYGIRFSV